MLPSSPMSPNPLPQSPTQPTMLPLLLPLLLLLLLSPPTLSLPPSQLVTSSAAVCFLTDYPASTKLHFTTTVTDPSSTQPSLGKVFAREEKPSKRAANKRDKKRTGFGASLPVFNAGGGGEIYSGALTQGVTEHVMTTEVDGVYKVSGRNVQASDACASKRHTYARATHERASGMDASKNELLYIQHTHTHPLPSC